MLYLLQILLHIHKLILMIRNTHDPVKPCENEGLVIFLISEELKSRRFFSTLQNLGLENSYYQPHLDEAILAATGLTDERNETFDFYCAVMDEHAGKIGINKESVAGQAREALARLKGFLPGPQAGAQPLL
jgi:hypothetical protein